jgi:hypothetical protein
MLFAVSLSACCLMVNCCSSTESLQHTYACSTQGVKQTPRHVTLNIRHGMVNGTTAGNRPRIDTRSTGSR